MFLSEKEIFDTRFDTKKYFVTMRSRFSLRSEKNKDGKSLLYLDISDKFTRPRLKTNIYIEKKYWDPAKQRVKPSANSENFNLIIENLEAKIITIKTRYTIMQQFLSAERLIEEIQNVSPNFDFISFFRHHLNIQDHKPRTHKNHTSVLNKLMEFSKEIPFHKIDESFFANYRKWCTEVKKNKPITYNSDVKTIKKYLNIALDKGIVLNINLKKLKINVHSQKRIYLQKEEVARLKKYYFNEFINPSHVIPLGTFLIACYTGMRISDLQGISRKELLSNIFNFSHQKSDNFQSMKANSEAIEILEHVDFLFEKKMCEQKINKNLKSVAIICKIQKKITMHVARHTFATTYIRNGGNVLKLQKLLGHSQIKHTLVYVHLVESELLDDMEIIKY
jgi:site-specific recombinase XerD